MITLQTSNKMNILQLILILSCIIASRSFIVSNNHLSKRNFLERPCRTNQLSQSKNNDSSNTKQQRNKKSKRRFLQNAYSSQNNDISTPTNYQSILKQQQQQQQNVKGKHTKKKNEASIKELEAKMNQKFSNNGASFTNTKSSFTDKKKKNGKQEEHYVKEYYDDDDEGYEADGNYILDIEGVDDKEDDAVVLPKSKSYAQDGGGIFGFKKQIDPEEQPEPKKSTQRTKNEKTPPKTSISPKQVKPTKEEKPIQEEKPKKKKEIIPPLLDSNGNPKELTLESIQTPTTPPETNSKDPKTFQEMSLHPSLIQNLQKLQCTTPLYVQQRSYNVIYNKEPNVILATSTGSGKTLAFLLPILQRSIESPTKNVHTLIVVPGRELASQIYNVAQQVLEGEDLNVKVGLCIGGTSYQRNIEMLRKKRPNIIVGTPGRIHELLFGKVGQTPKLKIKNVDTPTLILDEFDDLFSNNKFDQQSTLDSLSKQSTREIYNFMDRFDPKQVIFCSATALFQSKGYNKEKDWKIINQKGDISLSPTTKHGIIHATKMKKIDMIRRIVNTEPNPQQIIMFVNHVSSIDNIVNQLRNFNIIAVPLHAGTTASSNTSSQERALITKELREGYIGLVVTTELLARGLDAPYATHVINYDIPTNSVHYVHRIGRVGRNGRKGIVLNLVENRFEEGIYRRFGGELDLEGMCVCEPRGGKLTILKEF